MESKNSHQASLDVVAGRGSFRRVICSLLIFVCSFVWYSPSVYALVEELGGSSGSSSKLHQISPLAGSMKGIRTLLEEMHTKIHDSPNAYLRDLGSLKAEMAAFRQLDQEYRAERQMLLSKTEDALLKARIEGSIEEYNQQSDLLWQRFLSLSSGKLDPQEVSSDLDAMLGLLSAPMERPYQSYSSDLDFIDPPPREIYGSQAEIEAFLGISGEPASSDAEYLQTDAATEGTEAIALLVQNLNYDPLSIYNWAYDNIRWLPQYGSMQSADYTLQTGQGNAFDISSLLVAMLREAGYPARYMYGTVSVPREDMQNWVGDVVNADAATNLLSQGGVPQRQLLYGGSVHEIQLEHVWAQVRVGGIWTDMDASLKDYSYSEGIDLQQEVSFDAEGMLAELEASSTSSETEGWVQGLDASIVESRLSDFESDLENYLVANVPNATLGDVLGLQVIIPSSIFSLDDIETKFSQIAAQQALVHLPDQVRYKFQLQIGSATGGLFGDPVVWSSQLAELSDDTTALLGKSLAISFRPATEIDEQLLASYLPEEINSIENLPDSIPAGDVQMVGEITADGQVVASTPAQPLGGILMTRLGFIGPDGQWRFSENNLIAGQYQAVGIDMQGISPAQLEALQARLENTQTDIESENYAELDRHDVVGDLLQAGIQGYLATTYAMDRVAAQAADIVYLRRPSFGTFGLHMEVAYLFGIPQTVNFAGVVMDADRVASNTEHQGNCYEDWVAFNRSSGMRNSALEHQIPEQLFSTETEPAEGVSTAKALSIAAAEGQRIYTLTQENAGQLVNISIDDGARAEIQTGLSQGMEVIVHQSPISVGGWNGSGYAILDSDYGVGAYKISGGESGGYTTGISPLAGLSMIYDVARFAGLQFAPILGPAILAIGVALDLYQLVLSNCPAGSLAFLLSIMILASSVTATIAISISLGPVGAFFATYAINLLLNTLANFVHGACMMAVDTNMKNRRATLLIT